MFQLYAHVLRKRTYARLDSNCIRLLYLKEHPKYLYNFASEELTKKYRKSDYQNKNQKIVYSK